VRDVLGVHGRLRSGGPALWAAISVTQAGYTASDRPIVVPRKFIVASLFSRVQTRLPVYQVAIAWLSSADGTGTAGMSRPRASNHEAAPVT